MAATWNPSDKGTPVTLTGSNLIATITASGNAVGVRATLSQNSGKYYFELVCGTATGQVRAAVGLDDGTLTLNGNAFAGSTAGSWSDFQDDGPPTIVFKHNNVNTGTPGTQVNSSYVMVAWDANAGNLWFGLNGSWNTGNPALGTSPTYTGVTGTLFPVFSGSTDRGTQQYTARFTSGFSGTIPSGFVAWDTVPVQGSAAITETTTVTATAAVLARAAAAVTGTATVAATAFIAKLDAPAITATATVTATASAVRTGSAALAGTATVSAIATAVNRGVAAVTGTATVTATAQVIQAARAAISGGATVAVAFSDPASAANLIENIVSVAYATGYNPNYVSATPLGSVNPCLQKVVPSYLYEQYQDDDDLQAFVTAYNTITQQYVSWLNDYTLPVYTNPLITGDLLDWIARGLYGVERPSLSAGSNVVAGPYNTNVLNYLTYNGRKTLRTAVYTPVDDDIFKRILTWKLYKGDGKVIGMRWLKRRVYRFLFGPNGTDVNCGDTSGISVTFEQGTGITITVIMETTTGDARVPLFNAFRFNETNFDVAKTLTKTTQSIQTYTHGNGVRITLLDNPPNAAIFQEAVEQGILELPFQFDFVVSI